MSTTGPCSRGLGGTGWICSPPRSVKLVHFQPKRIIQHPHIRALARDRRQPQCRGLSGSRGAPSPARCPYTRGSCCCNSHLPTGTHHQQLSSTTANTWPRPAPPLYRSCSPNVGSHHGSTNYKAMWAFGQDAQRVPRTLSTATVILSDRDQKNRFAQ